MGTDLGRDLQHLFLFLFVNKSESYFVAPKVTAGATARYRYWTSLELESKQPPELGKIWLGFIQVPRADLVRSVLSLPSPSEHRPVSCMLTDHHRLVASTLAIHCLVWRPEVQDGGTGRVFLPRSLTSMSLFPAASSVCLYSLLFLGHSAY